MADEHCLQLLREGVRSWNRRRHTIKSSPAGLNFQGATLLGMDLKGADLSNCDLSGANLSRSDLSNSILWSANLSNAILTSVNFEFADLRWVNFANANLRGASLRNANLTLANLHEAQLTLADLSKSILCSANLDGANLTKTLLTRADLSSCSLVEANLKGTELSFAKLCEADLTGARLLSTVLDYANLDSCSIYGISAWDVRLEGANQLNLRISKTNESPITVDTLEIAQFIHILLDNHRIRYIINALTSKIVLILGRFTKERKVVLDALRKSLREHNYLPILFDFEKPMTRDFTETISTLAHLARFIIADLTEAKSIPQELQEIVPTLAIPVKPLLYNPCKEYRLFADMIRKYHWILPVYRYTNINVLLAELEDHIIIPAEAKASELDSD